MSITDHKSSKAVCVYKQISIEQEEQLCDLINTKMKMEKTGHEVEKEDKNSEIVSTFIFNN